MADWQADIHLAGIHLADIHLVGKTIAAQHTSLSWLDILALVASAILGPLQAA